MWRPRLSAVLIAVNLLCLILPVGALLGARWYDNELIRMTEVELIDQAALLSVAYREALRPLVEGRTPPFGRPLPPGRAAPPAEEEPLRPILPGLDIEAELIRGRAPTARPPSRPPELVSLAAGEAMRPYMEAVRSITLAGARVVDPSGVVVASSGEEYGLSLEHREEVERALAGEFVRLLRDRISDEPSPPLGSLSRGTSVRVFVAAPVVYEGRVLGAVVLSRTPLALPAALHRHQDLLLTAMMGAMGVVIGVSLLTSLAIGRPIAALTRQARALGRGETGHSEPLRHPVTWEVEQLSAAILAMARDLAARGEYIRSFATHVSHEFKTPLTSIQGAVELLSDHWEQMSEEERRRFLAMLEADTRRLDRLVRKLMELARADVLTPGEQTCEVGGVLAALTAGEGGARVTLKLEGGALPLVRMDAATLESITRSLLDNARQHGGEGVHVLVQAREDEHRAAVILDVTDDGAGISPANQARIFEPFFTTARDRGGTGLGLAVVRALLTAHGGDITLVPSERGAHFRVRLPAAAPHNRLPPPP